MYRNSKYPGWKITLILFFISFCFLNHSRAQGTEDAIRIADNEIGFGTRALGMGGAYAGVADDYSAIFWNPGGLAQMLKMEFWMDLSNLHYTNDATLNSNSQNSSVNATKFNSIGMVFPVPVYRGSLVFALGYQKIKDFEYINDYSGISNQGTDWLSFSGVNPNNPDQIYDFFGLNVQKKGLVNDEGSMGQWSFAGALDVSPNLSVGLSLNYWRGTSDYTVDFLQTDSYGNFDTFPADFDSYQENRYISDTYSSLGLKLGGLLRLNPSARIGAGIEIPQSFTVKEDWGYDASLLFDDGFEDTFQDNASYEYDVHIPFRFEGGVALSLGTVLASGSIKYTDWTQVKFNSSDERYLNPEFKTDYRGTFKLQAGTEVGIPVLASQVRAGFIYNPTPLKGYDSGYNRKFFTLGYGVLFDRVIKLDLAYMYGWWKQLTSDDLNPAGTSEDIHYHKFLIGFSYRF
jgi:long-subunit fatty acid transport protein